MPHQKQFEKGYHSKTTDTETVAVTVVRETEAAYLFKHKDGREAFFPKSQVSFERRNVKTGEASAKVPVWLLEAKGW